MRTLLGQNEINPDTANDDGRAPLSFAASHEHEAVVKILLRRNEVNPTPIPDQSGQTPLMLAAETGHEGVLRILLGWNDINPGTADNSSQTPLSRAARNGHEIIIELLRD